MRKRVLIVLFLTLAASVAMISWEGRSFGTTTAGGTGGGAAQATEDSFSQADGVSGARVGRDPVTGTLRPTTAQENAALARAMEIALARRPSHSVRRGPDGSLALVAAPHFLSLSVARVSSDGTLSVGHADPQAATTPLRSAATNETAELPKE